MLRFEWLSNVCIFFHFWILFFCGEILLGFFSFLSFRMILNLLFRIKWNSLLFFFLSFSRLLCSLDVVTEEFHPKSGENLFFNSVSFAFYVFFPSTIANMNIWKCSCDCWNWNSFGFSFRPTTVSIIFATANVEFSHINGTQKWKKGNKTETLAFTAKAEEKKRKKKKSKTLTTLYNECICRISTKLLYTL